MDDLVAAIDGGGSKTRAAVVDRAGAVRVFAATAGCNPGDNPRWLDGLAASIAHLGPLADRVRHLSLGLPGFAEIPAFDANFRREIARLYPGATSMLNDVELAHLGAFGGGTGVLILAGTGSMAMAGTAGNLKRVGGWGELIGDEGSAFWIGRAALSRTAKMLDGREPGTAFSAGIRRAMGLEADAGGNEMLDWAARQAHIRSAVAALARPVDALAEGGDVDARNLLTDAAGQLHAHVLAAASAKGLPASRWSHAGSVFLSQTVLAALTKLLGAPPSEPVLPPLGGGLLHAAGAAGWTVTQDWTDAVAAGLSAA